jgi:hypothetical protein
MDILMLGDRAPEPSADGHMCSGGFEVSPQNVAVLQGVVAGVECHPARRRRPAGRRPVLSPSRSIVEYRIGQHLALDPLAAIEADQPPIAGSQADAPNVSSFSLKPTREVRAVPVAQFAVALEGAAR